MACTAPPTTEPNGERSAAPDSLPVEDDDDSDDGDEMVEINIFNDMVNVDYEPLPAAKISPGTLFRRIHRLDLVDRLDGRAKEKKLAITSFFCNYKQVYIHLTDNMPTGIRGLGCQVLCSPCPQLRVLNTDANSMVKHQLTLQKQSPAVPSDYIEEEDNEDDGAFAPRDNDLPGTVFQTTWTEPSDSPAMHARRLLCETGAFKNEEQSAAVLFCVRPLQELWDFAVEHGRLKDFCTEESRIVLIKDAQLAQRVTPARIFLHGVGGSGKTFCLLRVILPVYERYLPGHCRKLAAQNSAARLLMGSTIHAATGMALGDVVTAEKPSGKKLKRCIDYWRSTAVVLIDECGVARPDLFLAVHASIFWGRQEWYGWDPRSIDDRPLGDVLLQVFAADFGQLEPVRQNNTENMSLMSEWLAPALEPSSDPDVQLQRRGLRIWKKCVTNCLEFRGTFRFKPGDAIIPLLSHMRKPGGGPLPEELKEALLQCMRFPDKAGNRLTRDNRDHPFSTLPDALEVDPCSRNNFTSGYFSAINWEQVTRLQALWVSRNAALSAGPVALRNAASGRPVRIWRLHELLYHPYIARTWPSVQINADNRQTHRRLLPMLRENLGQIVFWMQRVDKPTLPEHRNNAHLLSSALDIVSMTTTARLQSWTGIYLGLAVKITQKLFAPEVVQEAIGEIIDITFHSRETFGGTMPAGTQWPPRRLIGGDGTVFLSHLPSHIALRIHGSATDFTGANRPGVYILQPRTYGWKMSYRPRLIIDHPNARPVVKQGDAQMVQISSTGYCIAPAYVGTNQNQQGKTTRDECGVPMAHTIDMLMAMSGRGNKDEVNKQLWNHYHMILGRATSLANMQLHNFPMLAEELPDWSVFEMGPPAHLVRVFAKIAEASKRTLVTIETLRQASFGKFFPAFKDFPTAKLESNGTYRYVERSWTKACRPLTDPSPPATNPVTPPIRSRPGNEKSAPKRSVASLPDTNRCPRCDAVGNHGGQPCPHFRKPRLQHPDATSRGTWPQQFLPRTQTYFC